MPPPPTEERCALCGVSLDEVHRHLVDTEQRSLTCACTPCAVLFERPGAAGGRFHTVPTRYLTDPAHDIGEGAWHLLGIPVGVAFFFHHAALDRLVALYPSPAGATESELDPATWQRVLGGSPLAAALVPDVEALLVRRSATGSEMYLVPVDVCYELVGRMRLYWKGFDGGARARAELAQVFERVARRARTLERNAGP